MAAQKRVDNKRRILKDGESQLPDGRYRYRYFDMDGCRQVVYSWKLVERDRMPPGKKDDLSLREKERQIERDMEDSIKTGRDAKITLNQMFETYMTGKISLKCINRCEFAICTDFFRHSAGDFLPPCRDSLPPRQFS